METSDHHRVKEMWIIRFILLGVLAASICVDPYFAAEIMEERYDVGARFHEQYQAYKRTTRMFGPIWLWSVVVVIILLLVGFGWTTEIR